MLKYKWLKTHTCIHEMCFCICFLVWTRFSGSGWTLYSRPCKEFSRCIYQANNPVPSSHCDRIFEMLQCFFSSSLRTTNNYPPLSQYLAVIYDVWLDPLVKLSVLSISKWVQILYSIVTGWVLFVCLGWRGNSDHWGGKSFWHFSL